MRARLALAGALLLGAGCARTQKPDGQQPGSPGLPLRGAVTAVEITADGEKIAIPAEGITDVDINSTVALTMNPAEIATEAKKVDGGASKGKSVDFAAQLRAMDDVTNAEQASAERLQTLVTALAGGHAPAEAQLKELGRLEGNVVAAVGKYCDSAGVDRATRSRLFAEPGYAALAPWINQERSRLLAMVQTRLEQLPSFRWRMEATSSRAGAIHLPNYDDLPEGTSTFINKIAMHVDDQTKQSLAAATKLSADVNKLIDQQGSLGAAFQQVLVEKAGQAAAAWEDWTKQDLAAIEALVEKLKKTAATDQDVKAVVTSAGDLVREGQALQAACAGAFKTLQTIIDTHSISGDLGALATCTRAVRDNLAKIRDQAKKAATAAQALVDKTKAATGPALAAVKDQLAGLQTVVHAKQALDKVQETWTALAGALDLQPKLATPAWRSDHFQDQPLTSALDTAIDLTRTNPRQDGDAVFFRPAISKDGAPALVGVQKALRLKKVGTRVDVGAAVTFVRPQSLKDGEDTFRAAPAVTAALHYRDWRGPDENTGNRFWNFIDPGFGFHVVYPDLGHTQLDAAGKVIAKDPSVEIGVGGVVQLLGDLFQAGYGYDIQVGRAYWYFGFGLQRLIDLGVSLPVTGERSPANQ